MASDFFLVELFELSAFIEFLEVDLIVLCEETVFEHALALVQPALGNLVRLSTLEIRFVHKQALDDARHVSEVELVEEFSGGRTHFYFNQD